MHIIALENEPSSRRGGQELNLLEICRGLARRQHSISLIYLQEGDLLKQYQEFCTHIVKADIFILDRKTITHTFNFLTDIWKISVSQDSIVFSNQYHNVFFGSMLGLLKRIPLVCYLQIPPLRNGFPRPLAWGLKNVKRFIAVSHQTKWDWVESGFNEEKINVVYNGTNPEVFQPSNFSKIRQDWHIPEDQRVISYVGRLDIEKGLETLLRASALLIKEGTKLKLLIAGKPVTMGEEYKQSLEQLSVSLGIENCVQFLGHVSHTASVYQVSDVTVLPSWWSEPFARSVIESMACGTPVVASRVGGIPEFLTGEFQNQLFQPRDEQSLAKTLQQVINWRVNDIHLGERCREHVLAKFTFDNMVDGVEKVLLSIARQ